MTSLEGRLYLNTLREIFSRLCGSVYQWSVHHFDHTPNFSTNIHPNPYSHRAICWPTLTLNLSGTAVIRQPAFIVNLRGTDPSVNQYSPKPQRRSSIRQPTFIWTSDAQTYPSTSIHLNLRGTAHPPTGTRREPQWHSQSVNQHSPWISEAQPHPSTSIRREPQRHSSIRPIASTLNLRDSVTLVGQQPVKIWEAQSDLSTFMQP